MSHLIENMAYAGELPWHGLGFEVSNDLSPEEMMVAAGCNWEVSKVPTYALFNEEYIDTGKASLVRMSDKTVLDVISEDWNPTQNRVAFDFFKEFVEEGHMEMHTAGSLDNGRIVWALAKINKSFEAVKDDVIEGYLLFTNPHIYGKAINVRFTPIRVVCNNTLTFALSTRLDKDMSVSVNHSKVFDPNMVKNTLMIADSRLKKYEERAKFLSSKMFDKDSVTLYLKQLFPTASKKDEDTLSRPARTILEVLETQPGADFAPGSWWNAFNAVTYASDHILGRSNDTRLRSAWYGINQTRKLDALNKAVEFAEAV